MKNLVAAVFIWCFPFVGWGDGDRGKTQAHGVSQCRNSTGINDRQLVAGRRGKGLVRRLAVLWREECRPRFYDAELRIVIDDWCAFKGDATKFRAPVKWTPELLAEMKKYREAHGTKATAAKYGISASLVRAKVPLRLRQGK